MSKRKSLVIKAKSIGRKQLENGVNVTPEKIELAVAWANDEVSLTQVKEVLQLSSYNDTYRNIAFILKEHSKKTA